MSTLTITTPAKVYKFSIDNRRDAYTLNFATPAKTYTFPIDAGESHTLSVSWSGGEVDTFTIPATYTKKVNWEEWKYTADGYPAYRITSGVLIGSNWYYDTPEDGQPVHTGAASEAFPGSIIEAGEYVYECGKLQASAIGIKEYEIRRGTYA